MLKIMQIYQQQSTQVSQYTLCLKLERFLEIIILNTVQKITINQSYEYSHLASTIKIYENINFINLYTKRNAIDLRKIYF